MTMKTPCAVIAGAGVAGLAAAWWLTKIGWQVCVAERATHLRDGGHMMGLSGPGLATVRRMGLVPRLKAVAYPDMGVHVYRNRHGGEIMRLDYRSLMKEFDWITVRRTELVRLLHEQVADRITLWLGNAVTGAYSREDGVTVQMADGRRCEADLLIAADGVHSPLRASLFASDAQCLRPLGYRYAAYDLPDALKLGESFLSYAEPGLQSEYYTLASQRVAALHVWRSKSTGSVPVQERLPLLRELTARSHPLVRSMLQAVEPAADVVVDDLALVELPQWHAGRVLLLGDAAHSLSLISGQGAGLALASASILADEIAQVAGAAAPGCTCTAPGCAALEQALQAHGRRLRPTVLQLQQRSVRLAPAFVPSTPIAFHLRNLALRAMPGVVLRRVFLNGLKSEQEALAALGSPSSGPDDRGS